MEFMKVFQEALTLGVTKEEFLDIWKIESQFKMAMHTKSQTSKEVVREDSKQKVKHCDCEGVVADRNMLKSMLDLQREECKQELNIHFQSMCKQLLEQQEQHWQQMQLRSDKLLDEIRYRIEVISNHISNTTDSNASSVKLHFMQEIELLKQDLVKVIMEYTVNNRPNSVLSDLPNKQTNMSNVQNITAQAKISDYNELKSAGNIHDKENDGLSERFQQKMSTLPLKKQHNLIQKTIESENEGKLETKQLVKEIEVHTPAQQPVVNCTTDVKVESDIDVVTVRKVVNEVTGASESKKLKDWPPSAPMLASSSVLPVEEKLVKDTEGSAMVATNHMEPTSPISFLSSENNDSVASLNNISPPLSDVSPLPDVSLSEGDQQFTIFVGENTTQFLSPFFYSQGKRCTVRVGINIEPTGALSFHLHVSRGAYDDDHKWPLNFTGKGLVFNIGSSRFTQIWRLTSGMCQKPLSYEGESIFKCEVCLSTSRGKHSEVTYNKLVSKNFANNQIMTFKTIIHFFGK